MKASLPVRLFLVHLVFTVGAGFAAVVFVARSFERYAESWERRVASSFADELYRPLAAEVARALLLAQESEYPEVRERRREQIASGLRTVLRELSGIRAVVVVDSDLRIQFASDESVTDLAFTKPADREFLSSAAVRSRPVPDGAKGGVEEVVIPVMERGDRGPGRRLGAVLVRLAPDRALVARVWPREVPAIPWQEFALPVIFFLAAAAVGGVAVAGLTGLPVRRLDRALRELRAKGFRGRLDAQRIGVEGSLAATVQAINELGGRIEALDERGREREALLQTLSQSLEDGMLALSPAGGPVAWNHGAVRLLAGEAGDGGGETDETRLHAALERNRAAVARAMTRGGAFEAEVERPDGSRAPLKWTAFPFEVRPGESGTLLLLRDLVTLRTLEAHLVDAGRFAVMAQLGAGLAHEIRNPLHSIGINASVVEEHARSGGGAGRAEAMAESLSTIREETQRLADLLNSYLGLVRADATVAPVDVREVCRRVSQLLAFPARKSRVEIVLETGEPVPPVPGIADRIQQAVLNLALNAIQAMPDGGRLAIAVRSVGAVVRVSVADTGTGVPEAIRNRILEGGLTTKSGGTGLGLPLVAMIARSHGGSVSYSPGERGGSVFVLDLPVRDAA